MELSVGERMDILEFLSSVSGGYDTGVIVKDTIEKINLSQSEIKEFNFKSIQTPSGFANQWNADAKPVNIKLTADEKAVILKGMRNLHNQEKIHPRHIDVMKRFKFKV